MRTSALISMVCLAASISAVGSVPASSQTTSGRRMAAPKAQERPDSLRATIVGTIVKIESMMDRDGPMWIFLDPGAGEVVKVVFSSLYTHPRPSDERLELYRRVATLGVGDHIRVGGYALGGGFALESMTRIDAEGKARELKLDLDEDWLMLIEQLPLGTPWVEVEHMFAEHGGLQSDEDRLTNVSTFDVRIQGYDAVLELTFDDLALHTCFFTVREIDETASQDLYDWLQKFYSERYGEFEEKEGTNRYGDPKTTSVWEDLTFRVILNRTVRDLTCPVSWGFEEK